MKISEFHREILSWIEETQNRTGAGVTDADLIRKFDEGIVLGVGYEGILYHTARLVKRGLLIEQNGRFRIR